MRNAATGKSKVTSLSQLVGHIEDGDVLGLGGFTLSRTQTAVAHEIIRQGKRDLTLVSTNISLQMDLLVGAGCVRRVEHGAASIERFGLTYNFRRAVEEGSIEVEDHSHLGMGSRFLAGSLGLPFLPIIGYRGTDLMRSGALSTGGKLAVIDDPFRPGHQVVLLPALQPDVAVIHAQAADEWGNVVIKGCTFHEIELARAADTVLVTVERIIPHDSVLLEPEETSIPFLFVDAVAEVPWGAYPTSCYSCYDYDAEYLRDYQDAARDPGRFARYLQENVYKTADYGEFLARSLSDARSEKLRQSMAAIKYGGSRT